jgi:hypothetical protein
VLRLRATALTIAQPSGFCNEMATR